MMRRGFLAGVLAVVLLCGCSAEQPGRVEALAEKYAALSGYVAEVKIDVPRADETLHYTLSVCGEGEETRVCVLSPEELAYLEEPYVPHALVGVMAQNRA